MKEFKKAGDKVTIEDVYESCRHYITNEDDMKLIKKAYDYIMVKHEGQKRKSGEPYTIHLIWVAYILSTLQTGPLTITAGLLHDVMEDCDVSREEMVQEFGEEVTTLVEGVTKISKMPFKDEADVYAENHRKIYIAMAKDIRVILIKFADRLHNMRTLQFMPPEKQKRISRETLEVYTPIAHRLGLSDIKTELEDLSLSYLDPIAYHDIARLLQTKQDERKESVAKMMEEVENLLKENHYQYRILGRAKSIYSIYKKMFKKHKRFDELYDLYALRIILQDKLDCYSVLGLIHDHYRPIPGRFKDYIAMPKPNMYQSLHTSVIGEDGNTFEIQIRTEDMDAIAERGVAAHWKYKEKPNSVPEIEQKEIEDKLSWFRDFSMMTDEESEDPLEYMNVLQKDIFEANVYCLTPRGKVIALPSGSTPIDFAYRIHTEVGHKTVGATVNGAIVPLNTPLKTGDVVDILTNNNSPGPSKDWIKIVKSGHARNKIRAFLQKQETANSKEYIKKGEQMLQDEFKRLKLDENLLQPKRVEAILPTLSFKNLDDLYIGIANKRVSLQAVVDRLAKNRQTTIDDEEIMKIYNSHANAHPSKKTGCGVIVPGIDTIQVSLANCCNPIPGDPILGYITKGQGVKVHRADCPNIINEKKRLIPVIWDENLEEKQYDVQLVIYSDDRNYLLSDIVTTLQQSNAHLKHVDSSADDNGITATTKLTITVKDADHLQVIMANLKKVRSVNEVIRTIQ